MSETYDRESVVKIAFEELERAKFAKTQKNEIALRFIKSGGSDGLLEGIQFNDIQVNYPSPTVELFEYYDDVTLVATVEATYTNSSKKYLERLRRI